MLVITYTSDHNHPWPTQRNALAGSTRNQPSKNTTFAIAAKNSPAFNDSQNSPLPSLKEEHTEMEDVYSEGFVGAESYRPALLDSVNHPHKDLFSELGDIEADPFELMFTQGFTGDKDTESNKALNPYWSL